MIWAVAAAGALATECPTTVAKGASEPLDANGTLARSFATLNYPEDMIRSFNLRAAVDSLRLHVAKDPESAKMEKAFPGFSSALLQRAPAMLGSLLDQRVPWLYRCMAEKLQRKVARPDLDMAVAYLKSEAGKQKLQDSTDYTIWRYLRSGPFSKSELKKMKTGPRNGSKDAPVGASRAAAALLPVLERWGEEQRNAEAMALGDLAEEIVAEMTSSDPA